MTRLASIDRDNDLVVVQRPSQWPDTRHRLAMLRRAPLGKALEKRRLELVSLSLAEPRYLRLDLREPSGK